jgi:hypothetical protein
VAFRQWLYFRGGLVNRRELKERLVATGVPEGDYFIVGIDSQQTAGKGGGFGELVLARAEDERQWSLLSEERGRVQRERRFATEAQACEAAWQELKPRDMPVRQRTPEERERGLARSRQAVAEYEKAAEHCRDGGSADQQR